MSFDGLMAMASISDRHRRDTLANHLLARLSSEHFNGLVGASGRVPLRGLHYQHVATSAIVRSNGLACCNTDAHYV